MKKIILYLGIFVGIIYSCASTIYFYNIIEMVKLGFITIKENANFSIFTNKTYFEVYSPYVIQLFFCLLLALFLIFYFFNLYRLKIIIIQKSIISLVWCSLNAILILSPITTNIFFETPRIPISENQIFISKIEPASLPHLFVFMSTLLMIAFMVFCIFINRKYLAKSFQRS